MTVPFKKRVAIEQEAMEALRRHNLVSVPVDVVSLANKEGIKVHNAKFNSEGLSGLIAKRGDISTILVDHDESPYRKRFTIAHELGHHFLHLQHEDGEFIDRKLDLLRQTFDESEVEPIADRRPEIQANQFAAALLMPADLLKQEWETSQDVEEIARKFNVSQEALAIRLDVLGVI